MSWKISGLVWELELTHSQQSILMAMADHAEHDGSKVFPSVARISWKTGYSDRHVRRVMKDLRNMEILVLVEEATRRRPREYRIDISAGKKKPKFRGDMVSDLAIDEEVPPTDRADIDAIRGDKRDISDPSGVTSCQVRDDTGDRSGVTPESVRGDIAVSAELSLKTNETSLNQDQETFPSQDPWKKVLEIIASTYYPTRTWRDGSDWRKYWHKANYVGQRDGKHIVLCDTEEQRIWLEDRGQKIAENALAAVLGVKAEIEFVVEGEDHDRVD